LRIQTPCKNTRSIYYKIRTRSELMSNSLCNVDKCFVALDSNPSQNIRFVLKLVLRIVAADARSDSHIFFEIYA